MAGPRRRKAARTAPVADTPATHAIKKNVSCVAPLTTTYSAVYRRESPR